MKANSQRVKGKNFRLLNGKPLFRWILDSLLAIDEIDAVIINTDARHILAENGLVESDRVIIRDRKPELCGDEVSMNLILGDDIAAVEAVGNPTAYAKHIGLKGDGTSQRLRYRNAKRRVAETETLENAGYDLNRSPEISPKQAWDAHTDVFERKIIGGLEKQWRTIKRPRGAFVIFHQTDPHVDDDGSALKLIEKDIQDSQDLDAIMCH